MLINDPAYDYEEPKCPICNSECNTVYVADGNAVGCELCLEEHDPWEYYEIPEEIEDEDDERLPDIKCPVCGKSVFLDNMALFDAERNLIACYGCYEEKDSAEYEREKDEEAYERYQDRLMCERLGK